VKASGLLRSLFSWTVTNTIKKLMFTSLCHQQNSQTLRSFSVNFLHRYTNLNSHT
ncbi:hypothetical protein MKX03_008330, partial [Papaver bracteatum]